jgi:hypothetical protein
MKKGQLSIELIIILSIIIIVIVIASIAYFSLVNKDVQDTSGLIEEGTGSIIDPIEKDPSDYNVITQLPVGLINNTIHNAK